MKEIKKSASFKSKQKGKDVKFNIDLNYSSEYDSFIIKVKQGEGFMAYSSNIERMPLEVIKKLNNMIEEVLVEADSNYHTKKFDYDFADIGQFSLPDNERNKTEQEYVNLGKKIVKTKFDGDLSKAYDSVVRNKREFGGDFQAGVYEKGGSLSELNKKVMSYDKPIQYNGNMYATIYGANFRNTVAGTQKGEVYWTSTNEELLKKINKEIFNSDGSVMRFSELDPNIFILSIELSKIKITYELGGDFQAGVYAKGGSLEAHGIKEGDTFLRTISGVIQKVKDKNGNIVYINLSNGERDSQPPLPFNKGGAVTNERKHVNHNQDYEVRYAKPRPSRKGYKGVRSFDEGGDMDLTDDKRLRLRKPVMPERKLTEQEWAEKHNPRAYEYMGKRKMATGGGVGLIGNQKRIDMNHNGKIDAEDFKLLRSSMNGAWRNERKHVNHNEDYEVRYAKPRPNRTGYKGKRKFGDGGGISNFERLSRVVAKNYEGKRVKPQYQKEYGKVYSKSEAKEVGNKVAGKVKAMQKAESGTAVKKGSKGGVMVLAKQIRKDGESWKDAMKRASQQLK